MGDGEIGEDDEGGEGKGSGGEVGAMWIRGESRLRNSWSDST